MQNKVASYSDSFIVMTILSHRFSVHRNLINEDTTYCMVAGYIYPALESVEAD